MIIILFLYYDFFFFFFYFFFFNHAIYLLLPHTHKFSFFFFFFNLYIIFRLILLYYYYFYYYYYYYYSYYDLCVYIFKYIRSDRPNVKRLREHPFVELYHTLTTGISTDKLHTTCVICGRRQTLVSIIPPTEEAAIASNFRLMHAGYCSQECRDNNIVPETDTNNLNA